MQDSPAIISDGKTMLFNMGDYSFSAKNMVITNCSMNTYRHDRKKYYNDNLHIIQGPITSKINLELIGYISEKVIKPKRNIYEMSIFEIMEEVNRRLR
jgi:hypothetical protein